MKTIIFLFFTQVLFAETYYYNCSEFDEKMRAASAISVMNARKFSGLNCQDTTSAIEHQKYLVDLLKSFSETVCPGSGRNDQLQTAQEILEIMLTNEPKALIEKFGYNASLIGSTARQFNSQANSFSCETEADFIQAADDYLHNVKDAISVGKKLLQMNCSVSDLSKKLDNLKLNYDKGTKIKLAKISECADPNIDD